MIDVSRVRTALRISGDALDDELGANMAAAVLDMKRVGVDASVNSDELVDAAIVLYCRWVNDYQGRGDQYERQYMQLRDTLSLSGDYMKS